MSADTPTEKVDLTSDQVKHTAFIRILRAVFAGEEVPADILEKLEQLAVTGADEGKEVFIAAVSTFVQTLQTPFAQAAIPLLASFGASVLSGSSTVGASGAALLAQLEAEGKKDLLQAGESAIDTATNMLRVYVTNAQNLQSAKPAETEDPQPQPDVTD